MKTNLNTEYFTPKNATRRSIVNQQVNISENEQIESIYNTAMISDSNAPSNIEEALRGKEKEAWKKSAELQINNFMKRGSWEKVSREEAKLKAER